MITEFNNCFIIRSPRLFSYQFNHFLTAQGRDLPNVFPIMHEQNIICSITRLDGTTHEQTIIFWQLFAGHVVDSRPIERKEKTHRVIKGFIIWLPWKCFFGDTVVVPSGQDSSILPARVANQSARFDSSCPLTARLIIRRIRTFPFLPIPFTTPSLMIQ